MLVLALDTTTRQGSVALARDGALVGVYAGDAAITHGERLPGDVMTLLDAHHLRLADVDLFAVAAGPGSFTGLRIGIAIMQGFAFAGGKPLAGISALDATHEAVSSHLAALKPDSDVANDSLQSLSPQPSSLGPRNEVAIWMDAGRGQVFSAIYRSAEVVEAALVDKPAEVVARWARENRRPMVFAGDGALAYRELIRAAHPDAHVVEPVPLLAPSVARLAELQVDRNGASWPDAIKPIYVRRSDVELARDRAAVSSP